MPREELAERFPKGTILRCRVVRVEPFGAIVELEGQPLAHGLIRPSEWDWSGRLLDLTQVAAIGTALEARVTGHGDPKMGHRMVDLSRKLTLPDPFLEYRKKAKVGEVVRGQVQFVTHRGGGVLVSLGNGVDGFIPRSELPGLALDQEKESYGLFERDWVEGEIIRFTEENPAADRRAEVRLSIRARLQRRERDWTSLASQDTSLLAHPKVGPVLENLALDRQILEIQNPEVPEEVRERFQNILIVENNALVSESLDLALGLVGFACRRATNTEEAQDALRSSPFDLVILDFNLSRENGSEILESFASIERAPPVLLLTGAQDNDWSALRERTATFAGVFQKPTPLERLFGAMLDLARGQAVRDDRALASDFGTGGEVMRPLHQSPLGSAQPFDFAAALAQVRAETNADHAALLRYRPGPLFEAVAGSWPGLEQARHRDLEMSPLGDVLTESGTAFDPDTRRFTKRFWHLPYREQVGSFAGLRLGYRDQWTYGLFVSGQQPNQLAPATPEKLERSAVRIERALLEHHLQEMLTESQGMLLTGALANSLLHEVKNAAQALGPFSNVQTKLFEDSRGDLGQLNLNHLVHFKKSILGIHEIASDLQSLVGLFRDLAAGSRQEHVHLPGAIQRLHSVVKPLADPLKVTIAEPRLQADLPALRLSPKLLDQPLINLILNAVEQTGLVAGNVRAVRVDVGFDPDAEYPIWIDVRDTGPGIHFVHWQQIFEPFFSTKEKGTGLGLPISRLFIERLGGRVRLVDSAMFVGSTFRIELPKEVLA